MHLLLATLLAAAPVSPRTATLELSPGTWLFRTRDYDEIFPDGNTLVLASDDSALVFDANMLPSTSAGIAREVRRRTRAPVRWVVDSHWHWDHWMGNGAWRRLFPGLHVLAHEKTREDIVLRGEGHLRVWNEKTLPARIATLQEALADAERTGAPDAIARARRALAEGRAFQAEYRTVRVDAPDVTFDREVVLRLGAREVHVRNLGRGNTAGDAFLYLPREKLLATGDLLVAPVPYCYGVFPSEWVAVLRALDALDVDLLVPGHGPPMRDKTYLRAVIALFDDVRGQLAAARSSGKTLEQARASLALDGRRAEFTHGDPALEQDFRDSVVDAFPKSVWAELDGPLPDRPSPLPFH